jgi:uncharacterized protein (TIGR03083 family)
VLDAASISVVLDAYRPERDALVTLLRSLAPEDWRRPTECPAYDVQGVATHVLGDDLSLLSRQRDRAPNGLFRLAERMPGADFRTLLDTFNDGWVEAAAFLSPALVVTLLELTGEWTAAYYEAVDPEEPGEPVGFFGPVDGTSPFWHAIAREYVERWVHHSQILRALGRPSLADPELLGPGMAVLGAAFRFDLDRIDFGPPEQAAAILTRGHTSDEVRDLVSGPPDLCDLVATAAGRP